MTPPLKCAVIGVGYFGAFHAEKYKHLEDVDLVAVSDLNEKVGASCAIHCQTEFVKDYRKLLGHVEAVTVATSTSSHHEVAKFFLENGVHVFVEKPIARTQTEAEELCELAEKNNLKLQVNHIERFNPTFISAKNIIKDISFIECHRLSPFKSRVADVSVILDLMIHDLDLVLSITQSEVVHVSASGGPLLTKLIDIASARIEFASGATAHVMASRLSPSPQREVKILQSNGYLSMDLQSGHVSFWDKSELKKVQLSSGETSPSTDRKSDKRTPKNSDFESAKKTWSVERADALMEGSQAFVHSIQNNSDSPISGRQGLEALKLAERVTKSIYGTNTEKNI